MTNLNTDSKHIIKFLWPTLAALSFVIGAAGPSGGEVRADVVYDQPPDFPNQFSAWTSTYDPSTYGNIWRTYDNFTLGTTASLTSLTWQGFSFDTTTEGPTSIPLQAFNVDIYADNGGAPGTQVYGETIVATQTAAGTVDFFGNNQTETVYNYSAPLQSSFTALAGTTYWLSVQGITDYPAYWTWTSGTGGDGTSLQYLDQRYGGNQYVRSGDRAFSLATPEPSSIILLIAGALPVIVASTRRRPVVPEG